MAAKKEGYEDIEYPPSGSDEEEGGGGSDQDEERGTVEGHEHAEHQ
jgi:hypothetical protein